MTIMRVTSKQIIATQRNRNPCRLKTSGRIDGLNGENPNTRYGTSMYVPMMIGQTNGENRAYEYERWYLHGDMGEKEAVSVLSGPV